MTNQVIPAEAVEAAHEAWREQAAQGGSIFEYNLRAALEAAAPHMLAAVQANADELAAEYRRGYRDGLTDRKQVTADQRDWEPGDPIE